MSDFRMRVFRSAAKNLNFTKTAEELFITQPAVTRHIKELEGEYSIRLFERANGKLSLTTAGKLLLKHAEKILEDYQTLAYEMKMLQGIAAGELRIGASTTIAQYILPQALADFSVKYPQVSLSLMNGNTKEIEEALIAHEIDLGFVEGIGRQSALHYTTWIKDELVAIAHTGSIYADKDEITPEELLDIPVVLRERGSGTLAVFLSALQQNKIDVSSLKIVAHLGSAESIKRFIGHYNAIGIVSIRSVRKEVLEGELKVIDIKGIPIHRAFHLAQRHGQENGPVNDFLRYLSLCSDLL